MEIQEQKLAEARTLLHEAGFKATPARLALLALFKKTDKPISIKYIKEHLNTKTLQAKILKSSGFAKINEHSLEFFGICKSCAVKVK